MDRASKPIRLQCNLRVCEPATSQTFTDPNSDDADFITITGLESDGTPDRGIWATGGTTNFIGRDLVLQGHRNEGLRLERGSSASRLEDLLVSDNGGDGLYFGSGVSVLQDVTVRDNAGDGIEANSVGSASRLTVTRNSQRGLWADAALVDLSNSTVTNNGSDGVYTRELRGAISEVVISGNGRNGIYASRTKGARIEASEIRDNIRDGLRLGSSVEGTTVVGNSDLSLGKGNLVVGNGAEGIQVGGGTVVVGNTVRGHRTTGAAGLWLAGAATGERNVLVDNDRGAYLDKESNSELRENRIYENASYGVLAQDGRVIGNIIYSNGVGIGLSGHGLDVEQNLVYGNTGTGVRVRGLRQGRLINNTLYQTSGTALPIYGRTSELTLRNNIVVVGTGTAVSVSTDSQEGFSSDFNLFHVREGGSVGSWQGSRPTLAQWRSATGQDRNSAQQDPRFADPFGLDGQLGYVDETNDGRDDDFHLRSLYGRSTGNAAPAIDAVSGLPVMVTAESFQDTEQSPGIDRGSSASDFGREPVPNGGFVNLGAYGNTQYAALSPVKYVLVTRPNGGEGVPAGRDFNVTWRSHDGLGNVKVELVRDDDATASTVLAADVPNSGSYLWSIPADQMPGDQFRIRVTRDGQQIDISDQPFTITEPISAYYVNIGGDSEFSDNQYTTAAGDDTNDGLTPQTPMATIQTLLNTYDLGPGDTVYVDTGRYNLTTNAVFSSNDSGVTIQGPTEDGKAAILSRGNTNTGSFVVEFSGADNMTLSHLHLTDGYHGIYAPSAGSYMNRLVESHVYGNANSGVRIDRYNSLEVEQSVIERNGRHGIEANAATVAVVGSHIRENDYSGLSIRSGGSVVRDNVIEANRSWGFAVAQSMHLPDQNLIENNLVTGNLGGGIEASGNTLVWGNTVAGHRHVDNSSRGIELREGAVARSNDVWNNEIGIHASGVSLVENNRVFDSDYIGIFSTDTVTGNIVSGDVFGILLEYGGDARGNTVYGGQRYGIYVRRGNRASVVGNTIHVPEGRALLVGQNSRDVSVRENILASSVYGLYVSADSQVGFSSDYNLFDAIDGGSIAGWGGFGYFDDLADWSLELGQDRHSNQADPRFVDPAGPDGVLGWDRTLIGDPITIDDGDAGFSTTGNWEATTGHTGGDQLRTTEAGTATWSFDGLEPGVYEVRRSYRTGNQGSQAEYFYGDPETGGLMRSAGAFYQVATEEVLGLSQVASGSLEVTLRFAPSQGSYALADAITIQRIVGDAGADDNLHLLPGSPGIDAGRLTSVFDAEPSPNGGRRNLGAYGNTSEATRSSQQMVQVLAPNGLEKLEAENTVNVSWRYDGLPEVSERSDDYANAVLGSGPVGYWRIDEASGATVAADATGNHPGSYSGEVELEQSDPFGGSSAIRLGDGGRVNIPDHAALESQQLTYEAWVEIGELDGATETILSKGPHRLYREGSRLRANLSTSPGSSRDVYAELLPNRWFHVAFTYDGVAMRLYVDGKYVSGRTRDATVVHNSSPLRVGADSAGNQTWSNGLDEVAFYDRALSAEEIAAHYGAGLIKSPVRVELVEESSGTTVATLGSGLLGRELAWTVPDTIPQDREYRIRVEAELGVEPSDLSDQSFVIANEGQSFYVNVADDTDLTDNQYTTAAGDNRISGKTPDQPLASIKAVLDRYDLEPGDTIYVDTGTYNLATNIFLYSDDSGVTIQGPTEDGKAAILSRGNTNTGSFVVEFSGADNVTLSHLHLTDGYHGIYAPSAGSYMNRLVESHVYGNANSGVRIDRYNSLEVEQSVIERNGRHGIEANAATVAVVGSHIRENDYSGLSIRSGGSVVRDNVIEANRSWGFAVAQSMHLPDQNLIENNLVTGNLGGGIEASGNTLVWGNTVAGHRHVDNSSRGIELREGAVARSNDVWNNEIGIHASGVSLVENNRVFDNDYIGIYSEGGIVTNNQVSESYLGIRFRYGGTATGNTVYDSPIAFYVRRASDVQIEGNTVYNPAGRSVYVSHSSQDIRVSNNILASSQGMYIHEDGQVGFRSDHNLFYIIGAGNLAGWGGYGYFDNLVDWSLELGQDRNSNQGNPRFVDPDGPDDILGWDASYLGDPISIDDGDPGFSTTGIWATYTGHTGGDQLRTTEGGTATWTFTGLEPGFYEIRRNYRNADRTGVTTRYTIGDPEVGTRSRAQEALVANTTESDQWLADFQVESGTLEVTLEFLDGFAIADTITIQRRVGDGGADDNFHVFPGSPAIDAGNLDSLFDREPQPNGGRINLGAYGNTPEATQSSSEVVQGALTKRTGETRSQQYGRVELAIRRCTSGLGPVGRLFHRDPGQ